MRLNKYCLTLFLSLLLACLSARADSLLLDVSPTNNTTARPANFGPGQGVVVSTATVLDGFSMYVDLPRGGNLKYLIFNSTDSVLLFSQTQAVAASSTLAWIETTPFTFSLAAGSTYFFGVIADSPLDVGYIFPAGPISSNGLTALTDVNTNYSGFANPVETSGGGADIGLRLFGTQGISPTPEPSSLILLGTGALGLVGAARRRLLAS